MVVIKLLMVFFLVFGIRKFLLRLFIKTQNRFYYKIAGVVSFISVGFVPLLLSQNEIQSEVGTLGMIFLLVFFSYSMPKLHLRTNGKFSLSNKRKK